MFNVGRGRGRGRGGAEPPRRREDRDARDSLVAANRRLEHGGLPPTVIAARPPRGPRGRGRAGFGLPPNVRGRSAATGANATGGRGGGWAGRAADTYRPPASPRAERERNGDRELPKREPEDDRMPTLAAAAQPASEQQPARHHRFSPERTTSAAPSSVRPPAPRPVGLTLPPQIPRAYSPTRPMDMSYGGPSYLRPQQPEAGPSRPPGGAPVRPPLSSVTSGAPSSAPPSVRPPPLKPAPSVTAASGHRPNGAGVKEEPFAPKERPPIQKLKFKPRVLAVRKASSSTPEVPDAPVREDEKMDLGGEIDELEEETLGNGTGSGAEGVLAFSRTELPKDLWSKKRSILNDARTAFRKQHISRLSKEGKTVTQVFWRDDGVAFPWVQKTHNRPARSPSDSPIPLEEASTAKASPKAPASTVIDILSSSPTPLRQLSPPRPPATPTKPKSLTPKPPPSAKEDRHSLPSRAAVIPLVNAAAVSPGGPSTDDPKKQFLERIYGSTTQPGGKYRGPWPYRVFLKIPERWATKHGRAADRSGYEDWAVAQAQIARAKDAQGEPTRHFRLDHVHNDVLPISWAPITADSSLLTQFPLEALASEESVNALLENEAAQAELELAEKARLKRERRAARKAAAKQAAKEAAAKEATAKEAAAKEAAAKEAAAQSAPAMPPKRSRSQSSSEVEEPLEEPRPEPPKKKKQKKVSLLQTTPRASRAQQEEELALNDGRPSPHPPQAPQVAPVEIGKPTIVPPKPPPPATSAFLQELEHRILQKFASIDRWTRMLAEYPASAETLRKQIDRMQEEIFGIQQEIDAEKTRLKSATA